MAAVYSRLHFIHNKVFDYLALLFKFIGVKETSADVEESEALAKSQGMAVVADQPTTASPVISDASPPSKSAKKKIFQTSPAKRPDEAASRKASQDEVNSW